MSSLAVGALTLAAVTAVANWRAVMIDARRVEYVAKPLTIVLLIAVALLLDPADGTQRDWFVAALVASLVGDVALMLPSAGEARSTDAAGAPSPPATFVVGLLAFLLAHLGYLGGFLLGELRWSGMVTGVALVLVVAVTAGAAIVRGSLRAGDVVVSVALVVYLMVIGAMVVVAWGSLQPFAIVGATLFLVSDALIGWNRFVRPIRSARLAIMVTYHLGQAGLVVSLPFLN
jgi:uncharacterized membrane protein YhhN